MKFTVTKDKRFGNRQPDRLTHGTLSDEQSYMFKTEQQMYLPLLIAQQGNDQYIGKMEAKRSVVKKAR